MPTRSRPFSVADSVRPVVSHCGRRYAPCQPEAIPEAIPGRPARRRRDVAVLGLGAAALLAVGCSPYPDDGEFLAGVVYAANFLTGVKTLDSLPAVGQGKGVGGFAPYTLIATTQSAATTTPVTASTIASSPFWTDGKRKPLDRASTQPAYVLDTACVAPQDYQYDERLDLIRQDRQYPLFSDIPEYLTTSVGKAGRTAAYSAVIEVIHLSAPADLPCQSIKRFDTAQGRIGLDLKEVRREYRLLQIFDPAIALVPLPVQLGFYNQLVVPYIDMGPVPLSPDQTTFLTMPVYKATDKAGKTQTVVPGTALETLPPPNAGDPAYQAAKKTEALSSCLVCSTVAVDPATNKASLLDCPFRQSQVAK